MKRLTSFFIALACVCFFSFQAPLQARQSQKGLLLETIGVLSAQGVYLTYTSIGTLADGHSKGTYKNDFAVKLLNEYNTLCRTCVRQLNKLLSAGVLGRQDISFVSKLIETYELLIGESNAYKNYVLTGQREHIRVYSKKRRAAWRNISDLLGLNK